MDLECINILYNPALSLQKKKKSTFYQWKTEDFFQTQFTQITSLDTASFCLTFTEGEVTE